MDTTTLLAEWDLPVGYAREVATLVRAEAEVTEPTEEAPTEASLSPRRPAYLFD